MTLHLSYRTRRHLAEQIAQLPLGEAHYSYKHVYDKFVAMFTAAEVAYRELPMPEIYPGHLVPTLFAHDIDRVVHIAFKPFEELRLLKGAFNVAHVAWEHEKLPTFEDRAPEDPLCRTIFNDYVQVLNMFDEVWVGCEFARDVFHAYGLHHTFVVPAPIAVQRTDLRDIRPTPVEAEQPVIECTRASFANLRRLQGTRGKLPVRPMLHAEVVATQQRGGRVFVSVLNPGDQRKNIAAALLGFQHHWYATGRRDILIVKLSVDGVQHTLGDAVEGHLRQRFAEAQQDFDALDCPGIVLCAGHVSGSELHWLYRAADFYLCTSSAEGQNLPVLEGMAMGVVPVSPHTSAMADYLTPVNSFRIETGRAPVAYNLASAYGLHGMSWQHTSPRGVADALSRARRPDVDLKPMRKAARDSVEGRYSPNAVLRLVRERLDAAQRKALMPQVVG